MVILRSSPPPPATVVQQWVVADYAELRLLRADLRQAIETQTSDPDRELDDVAARMAIVATELATNALNHARSEAVVRLSRTKTTFVLDVADELPSVPPKMAENSRLGTRGRGLHITQELALDTGWYSNENSKLVWAEFGIPRRHRRLHAPRIPVFKLAELVRRLRRMRH